MHSKFFYDLFTSLKTFNNICYFQRVHYLQPIHSYSGTNICTLVCPLSPPFPYHVNSHPYIYLENECSSQCSNLQVSNWGIINLWPDLPLWICMIIFKTQEIIFSSLWEPSRVITQGIFSSPVLTLWENVECLCLQQFSKRLNSSALCSVFLIRHCSLPVTHQFYLTGDQSLLGSALDLFSVWAQEFMFFGI